MSRINSRNKGGRYEREMCKTFGEFWGADFVRTPFSGAFAGARTAAGDDSITGDIMTAHDENFPFSVEVKHREGWKLQNLFDNTGEPRTWWGQSVRDGKNGGKVPLLVFKKNYQKNDYVTTVFHPKLFEELLHSDAPLLTTKIIYEDEATGDPRGFLTITTHLDDFTKLGREFYEEHFTDYDWEQTEIEVEEREDKTIKESANDILSMMFDD